MALTDTKEMFRKAYEGHYAIGAFNVNNMEIIQGIMEAAHEEQSAVILQASEGARKYAGSPYIVDLVKTAVRQYPEIPVALHLDHGVDDQFSSTSGIRVGHHDQALVLFLGQIIPCLRCFQT